MKDQSEIERDDITHCLNDESQRKRILLVVFRRSPFIFRLTVTIEIDHKYFPYSPKCQRVCKSFKENYKLDSANTLLLFHL